MLKMGSMSKWNSKKADRYATLKEGDVLWANRIGKKEDLYSLEAIPISSTQDKSH
jgi:hypothetical protein